MPDRYMLLKAQMLAAWESEMTATGDGECAQAIRVSRRWLYMWNNLDERINEPVIIQ